MSRRRVLDLVLGCVVAMLAAWFLPHEVFPTGVIVLLAGAAGLLWRRPYVAVSLAIAANIASDVAYGVLPPPGQEWNVAAGIVVATSLGAFAPPLLAYVGAIVVAGSIALQHRIVHASHEAGNHTSTSTGSVLRGQCYRLPFDRCRIPAWLYDTTSAENTQ